MRSAAMRSPNSLSNFSNKPFTSGSSSDGSVGGAAGGDDGSSIDTNAPLWPSPGSLAAAEASVPRPAEGSKPREHGVNRAPTVGSDRSLELSPQSGDWYP